MSQKKEQLTNIFEDAAKRRNISIEQAKRDAQDFAKIIMFRIKTSNNQQLKDLWNEAFPNGKVPTAEEFVREWLLFSIFNPNGLDIRDENGKKIDLDRIYRGDI